MTNTEIKIECVKQIEKMVWTSNTGTDEAETLLSVLHEYEYTLVRELAKKPATQDDLHTMQQAIKDAENLLTALETEEPEAMRDWWHGIQPRNPSQVMGNFLSRVIVEMTVGVEEADGQESQEK